MAIKFLRIKKFIYSQVSYETILSRRQVFYLLFEGKNGGPIVLRHDGRS
jgi:hypothetical protein